ncbi:hypothetical protein [Deefgea sp. CFH1-16]|uniref:hypothetical protein n=1 Tax=Deefgea sp. CFH1-16 TaxID=2675457 RepID=UPI001FFC3576|nr:hypothetical protein [Deefgea sp. CFH1-16]
MYGRFFKTLADERKKREVEPTLSMLREALMETPANEAERHAQARMGQMHDLIDLTTSWFSDIQKLDVETLKKIDDAGRSSTKVFRV